MIVIQKHHAEFFRQSGWLMIAGILGGLMTFGVHFLSKLVPKADYADFGVLTMLTACIPAMPLQMVFGQQTAAGIATGREGQVAGMIRITWLWTFLLWLAATIAVFIFQQQIVSTWELKNPASLWVTMVILLFSLWLPLFSGVLQGKQDFFSMGWAMIIGGVVRLVVAALLVKFLHAGATGMVLGILVGVGIAAGIPIWRTRDLWTLPGAPFNRRSLFNQVLPLALGFGACQFMFTADTLFAKAYFGKDEAGMACYIAAGTLSRALLWLVLPLATVMFPKIVHSTARSEKSNLQGIVLVGTGLLGLLGVAGLMVLGPWVIRLPYSEDYVRLTMELLPWYAGAMVPLGLANVLINNLLARGSFRLVPALVLVAVAYGLALTKFHATPLMMLQTLAIFNVLLFAVCAFFTWVVKPSPPNLPAAESKILNGPSGG